MVRAPGPREENPSVPAMLFDPGEVGDPGAVILTGGAVT